MIKVADGKEQKERAQVMMAIRYDEEEVMLTLKEGEQSSRHFVVTAEQSIPQLLS